MECYRIVDGSGRKGSVRENIKLVAKLSAKGQRRRVLYLAVSRRMQSEC